MGWECLTPTHTHQIYAYCTLLSLPPSLPPPLSPSLPPSLPLNLKKLSSWEALVQSQESSGVPGCRVMINSCKLHMEVAGEPEGGLEVLEELHGNWTPQCVLGNLVGRVEKFETPPTGCGKCTCMCTYLLCKVVLPSDELSLVAVVIDASWPVM